MDDHSTAKRQDTGDERDRPPDGAQRDTEIAAVMRTVTHTCRRADVMTRGGKAVVLTDDTILQPTVKTGHVGKTKLVKFYTNPAKDELYRPTDTADGADD